MRYLLEFHEHNVRPYLLSLPLSREARLKLFWFLDDTREHADVYINSSERRLRPGSEFFRVDFVFRDSALRKLHHIEFILSDRPAQYGILRVVYVEDKTRPEQSRNEPHD